MLTANRSPLDHLVSGGISSLLSGANIIAASKAAATGYAAISASNAVAQKDYAKALAIAAAGWGVNKLIGETMNPYLNENPYLNANCPNCGWDAKQNKAKNAGNWNGANGWGGANWAMQNNAKSGNNNSFMSSPMLKGMLIGAAVAYLLSNKEAKDSLIKGVAKLQNFAAAAVEEIKEQIEDAKASMQD